MTVLREYIREEIKQRYEKFGIFGIRKRSGVWERRYEASESVLNGLLESEFKGRIKQEVLIVICDIENGEGVKIVALQLCPFITDGIALIFIQASNWERAYPSFTDAMLKETLRHELLHIETGLGNSCPEFIEEARKRGIELDKEALDPRVF